MARAEDLVVFKVVAGRPQDLSDALALLRLTPQLDLERIRARTRELAVLAEAPEIADQLETLFDGQAQSAPAIDVVSSLARRREGGTAAGPTSDMRPVFSPPVSRDPMQTLRSLVFASI